MGVRVILERSLVIQEVRVEAVVRAIMVLLRLAGYRARRRLRTIGVRSAIAEASGRINRLRGVPKITMGVAAVVRGILAERAYIKRMSQGLVESALI